jgi:hypothetical protein
MQFVVVHEICHGTRVLARPLEKRLPKGDVGRCCSAVASYSFVVLTLLLVGPVKSCLEVKRSRRLVCSVAVTVMIHVLT